VPIVAATRAELKGAGAGLRCRLHTAPAACCSWAWSEAPSGTRLALLLGQVYSGRLLAGALWCGLTWLSYWAVLIPGFLVHALCIWSAYQSAKRWIYY
jgi:hypothetical protein